MSDWAPPDTAPGTAGVLACEFGRRLAARADGWGEDAPPLAAEDGCGTKGGAMRGCLLPDFVSFWNPSSYRLNDRAGCEPFASCVFLSIVAKVRAGTAVTSSAPVSLAP